MKTISLIILIGLFAAMFFMAYRDKKNPITPEKEDLSLTQSMKLCQANNITDTILIGKDSLVVFRVVTDTLIKGERKKIKIIGF